MNTNQHLEPNIRFVSYIADGTSNSYSFNFPVWEENGVGVYIDDILQARSTYTVEPLAEFSGGSLIFDEAPASGGMLVIIGMTPRQRAVDYNEYATLRASAMNLDENYQEAQIQENTRDIRRAVMTPLSDGVLPYGALNVPPIEDRKNSYFIWDENGFPDAVPDVIKGHIISNNGNELPYKRILNFSRAFDVTDSELATNVELNTSVVKFGDGEDLVLGFGLPGSLNVRTLKGGDNIDLTVLADGSLEISAQAVAYQFEDTFTAADWGPDNQLQYLPIAHGLGENGGIHAMVRDSNQNAVVVDDTCTDGGVVTITCVEPFDGTVYLYGGYKAARAGMANVFQNTGDLVYSGDISGTPKRLGIGLVGQVLTALAGGVPGWTTIGNASLRNVDVAYGVPTLTAAGLIQANQLPLNTIVLKGTFGTEDSDTGGDLPGSEVQDGDIYMCVASPSYYSVIAGLTFASGQQAFWDGTKWFALGGGYEDATKADLNAGNLTTENVSQWRDRLRIASSSTSRVIVPINTVLQAPEDILVSVCTNKGDDINLTILTGLTPTTVTTEAAYAVTAASYGGTCVATAKIFRNHYYRINLNKGSRLAYYVML